MDNTIHDKLTIHNTNHYEQCNTQIDNTQLTIHNTNHYDHYDNTIHDKLTIHNTNHYEQYNTRQLDNTQY